MRTQRGIGYYINFISIMDAVRIPGYPPIERFSIAVISVVPMEREQTEREAGDDFTHVGVNGYCGRIITYEGARVVSRSSKMAGRGDSLTQRRRKRICGSSVIPFVYGALRRLFGKVHLHSHDYDTLSKGGALWTTWRSSASIMAGAR